MRVKFGNQPASPSPQRLGASRSAREQAYRRATIERRERCFDPGRFIMGAERLVLSTPEQTAQAEEAARLLGDRSAGIYPKAVMHVPLEIARAARDEVDDIFAVQDEITASVARVIEPALTEAEQQRVMRWHPARPKTRFSHSLHPIEPILSIAPKGRFGA
jgi:hypothetical protein